ncbi:hypothetical protein [Streptacidiphilus sp. PAMC 29251]
MSAFMSLHADANTRVDLNTYGTERTPILTLAEDRTHLSISTHDRGPLADHLAFARSLADATARYVTALEIFAVANTVTEDGS